MILGTEVLKDFKDVIDLETDSVTLEAMGEVFPDSLYCDGQKVIAEVGNASTEDVVIKAGGLVATVTLMPETAFDYETTTRERYAIIEFDYITSKSEVRDSIPALKNVLREDLEVDFSESKLSDEQKKIFKSILESFAALFVETSLKPGRADLLVFSINTGDHPPIKQ
ncbi:Hypothetical protein PHPALM_5931 [Phytophthora palmivora]|uniref:Uncharacterized protein n=1 Tax=Phytophthora palmivora TaxID=4796 RepID=A0A2P4YG64_9STRA|nr:Hypothetical protein PHPALM_5931 [Phytophthora palmivora]